MTLKIFALLVILAVAAYAKRPTQDTGESSSIWHGIVAGETYDKKIKKNVVKNDKRYPYMAHYFIKIVVPGEGLLRMSCGGTIIHPKIVLTASHCIYNEFTGKFVEPADIRNLIAGVYALDDRNPVKGTVSRIIRHENYHVRRQHNDIAILVLKDALPTNDFVQPIKLALKEPDMKKKPSVRIMGWGDTEDSDEEIENYLRYQDLLIKEEKDCSLKPLDDEHICAVGKTKKEVVGVGDSGGPGILIGMSPKKDQLLGVVSFGKEDEGTTIFISVPKLKLWLDIILAQEKLEINKDGFVQEKK